jgi:uncharacterized protein involved in outer membrane biogenesis
VPWPHFTAEDLTLGNPDWLKEPRMVGLERVEFRLAPLPLIVQRISIPRIDLVKPSASLTRLADGRANWTFDFGPKDENDHRRNGCWTSAPSASTKATSASTTRPSRPA